MHAAIQAIVGDPRFIDDAEFRETVAVNRGLQVRVFSEKGKALAWLE